jgi:hypothetical protein
MRGLEGHPIKSDLEAISGTPGKCNTFDHKCKYYIKNKAFYLLIFSKKQ